MFDRAGQNAQLSDLIDINQVINAYYECEPNVDLPEQKVVFGTSGHRGSSLKSSFNQAHIVAITQSIVEYRKSQNITGPMFIGFDTHILSIPAFMSALEVLVANNVEVYYDSHINSNIINQSFEGKSPDGCAIWTPTPALSHAILNAHQNLGLDKSIKVDGIVITPSHNPPTDGGFKYNPPHGGPADSDATKIIATRANKILQEGWNNVLRVDFNEALSVGKKYDFRKYYVDDLKNIIDFECIRDAKVRIGADPLGGASVDYWSEIAKVYQIDLTVINPKVDPTFKFMTLDWDEKIRMDCSSPNSMKGLVQSVGNSGQYDIMTGNDADSDRHGIVTADATVDENNQFVAGLMNPNHFLAVCIYYLFSNNRPEWQKDIKVGKTLVSSSLIDRVANMINAKLVEVPVGFKWFVPGLIDGSFGFGGEESAGASFLRFDGTVWTTDKDGIILALLASEIYAKTGKSPAAIHRELCDKLGKSWYHRIDAPASLEQKEKLSKLSPEQVDANELAGEKILAKLTEAQGNGAKIGGLKVVTENAWFAARPSGTENVYKIYAESFISPEHLELVQEEAKRVVSDAI